MTPEEKEKIEQLIALQKLKDEQKALSLDQASQYAALLGTYQNYKDLKADEMAAKLAQDLAQTEAPLIVIQEGKDNDSILGDYNALYKDEPWYKKPEPDSNGSTELAFPSYADAAQFFQKQAGKGREFVLIDAATNNVLAYSDGKGKMFHPDGKEFGKDDSFTPGLSMEEFSQLRQQNLENPPQSPGLGGRN